jgi:hypothetical protein
VSTHKPAALDHLLAVFGTHRRIEQLDEELRIAATHHSELDEHLRRQLADDVYDAPCSLITRTGAEQPITIHDTNAPTDRPGRSGPALSRRGHRLRQRG